MSTTLSTTQMVAQLQRNFPIGMGNVECIDFLNKGFRRINQMSKGGFIWQLKQGQITLPAGAQVANALPSDFDAGKTAIVFGTTSTPTKTIIPYRTPQEFVNEQHFPGTAQIGFFSAWTFVPVFTLTAPTSYGWKAIFAPDDAFPLGLGGIVLPLFYHAVSFQPFGVGATTYFPTPDEFDSFIVDLAEAEARRVYGAAGWEKVQGQATQALAEMIDTYRTDRQNLAGLADQVMQVQEKQAERAK